MNGFVNMRFKASKEVYDNDHNKLFGFTARQQGRKLVMIIEVFDESRRKEIVEKTKIMAMLAEKILSKKGIDRVCAVDVKEVTQQLSIYKIDADKFNGEQDVIIEVEDWVRGGFVSVDFTMGVVVG